jgi:hypothetical protein
MNYLQIETLTYDRQQMFLAEAEQRRLVALVLNQPHPLLAWVGQRLIRWGQQLQGEASPLLHLQPAQPARG